MPPHSQRRAMQNPYNSQLSRFAFGSRTSTAPAPLFYSATDDFREEDDVGEHDRDMADHYALQRSRRHFGGSNLSESSELDDDMGRRSDQTIGGNKGEDSFGYGLGRGIKSSWRGDKTSAEKQAEDQRSHESEPESVPATSEASAPSSKGKGKLVDVDLSPSGFIDQELAESDAMGGSDDPPPTYQQFRAGHNGRQPRSTLRTTLPIPLETDEEALLDRPRSPSPDRESVPQIVMPDVGSPPKHNFFWAEIFIIAQCSVFGVALISWLTESAPDKKHPLGDTIYTVLHACFRLIAKCCLGIVIGGMLMMVSFKTYVRPLIVLIYVAVPIISFTFFLYPFISSFKGSWHGDSIQDKVMRWLSFVPAVFGVVWIYTGWKARRSLTKASEMLEFAGRVLTANPGLLLVGYATLLVVVTYSWIWVLMFTRLFLGGHFASSGKRWIIDTSTWWLGVVYVLVYLWSLAVFSGIQRATTAATVSQWYFHRNNVPQPSSRMVVQASGTHATTVMIGTICLSTLLSLLIRAPLIFFPRRISSIVSSCLYSMVPTPIAVLTNPLTLTYASVHGMALGAAARGLSNMSFISKGSPTTTLGPGSFASPQQPYRLAKLLLHAIRIVVSVALGFGVWVTAARAVVIGDSGYKGSLYAYVVGLVAGSIGWAALGSMEAVLGGVLDALLVCWGSEVGLGGYGEVRYCREAGELFSDANSGRLGREP